MSAELTSMGLVPPLPAWRRSGSAGEGQDALRGRAIALPLTLTLSPQERERGQPRPYCVGTILSPS